MAGSRAPAAEAQRWRLGGAIGHQLDAAHHAKPLHIADDRKIPQLLEAGEQGSGLVIGVAVPTSRSRAPNCAG